MISNKSRKREVKDLQRLLLSVGLMEFSATSVSGVWGDETQDAVLRAYTVLGWEHPAKGRWISTSAVAAIASAIHHHAVDASEPTTSEGVGGAGSHVGGAGSHVGGAGSHVGGAGSHVGGAGSHVGGGSEIE